MINDKILGSTGLDLSHHARLLSLLALGNGGQVGPIMTGRIADRLSITHHNVVAAIGELFHAGVLLITRPHGEEIGKNVYRLASPPCCPCCNQSTI